MYKPDHTREIFKLIPGAVVLIQQNKCIACKQHVDQASLNTSDIKIEYIQTGLCPNCQNAVPPTPPAQVSKQSHLVVVIDRSGSMVDLHPDGFVEGYQTLIAEQKQLAQTGDREIFVTLCTFDDVAQVFLDHVNVENIPNYTRQELLKMFGPRNTTRLVDTLYEQTEKANQRYQAAVQNIGSGNVNCTILCWTDGADNASSRTPSQLNILISNLKKDPNFSFIFMAANQDAINTGRQFGIGAANCLTCDAVPACSRAVYRAASAAAARGVTGGVGGFTDHERQTSTVRPSTPPPPPPSSRGRTF